MQKDRDAQGNLQVDPQRFPQGIKPVARPSTLWASNSASTKMRAMRPVGDSPAAASRKAEAKITSSRTRELFASWGVDYLKLDGCNLYVPKGVTQDAAYRKAYAAQSAALKTVGPAHRLLGIGSSVFSGDSGLVRRAGLGSRLRPALARGHRHCDLRS